MGGDLYFRTFFTIFAGGWGEEDGKSESGRGKGLPRRRQDEARHIRGASGLGDDAFFSDC